MKTSLRKKVLSILTMLLESRMTLLYNNIGTTGGAITLSDSAANYDLFIICFKTNDNHYDSTIVYKPDGKRVDLITGLIDSSATHTFWTKASVYYISGTRMEIKLDGAYFQTGQTAHNAASHTLYYDRLLTITQVIGIRKVW